MRSFEIKASRQTLSKSFNISVTVKDSRTLNVDKHRTKSHSQRRANIISRGTLNKVVFRLDIILEDLICFQSSE